MNKISFSCIYAVYNVHKISNIYLSTPSFIYITQFQTMKFFPIHYLYAQLLAIFWICLITLTTQDIFAQAYRLRTETLAKATEFIRSDQSVAAQRPVSQSLSLWGYNLLGHGKSPLELHLQVRYFHDFSNAENYRDPYLNYRFNRISIDQAWIQWTPLSKLKLRGGRFLSRSIFQTKDLDGLSVSSIFGTKTRWRSNIYGGLHVVGRPETLNPDQYDIQGKPIEIRQKNDNLEIIYGARTQLIFKNGNGSIAYEKRLSYRVVDHVPTLFTNDERIAVTAVGNPTSQTLVSGLMSFHALSNTLNRGHLDFTWRPNSNFYTRSGFQHIIPTFDADSIFNLFGSNPNQSLFSTVWLGNNQRGLQTRVWIKSLNGDGNAYDFGNNEKDLLSYGFALNYSERFKLLDRVFHFNPSISFQPGNEKNAIRDQFIGRILLRFPLFNARWIAGSTLLWVGSENIQDPNSHFAFTQRLGADFPTGFGIFSLASVLQNSNRLGHHLNLFASFETEFWL